MSKEFAISPLIFFVYPDPMGEENQFTPWGWGNKLIFKLLSIFYVDSTY